MGEFPQLVVSDSNGKIYSIPFLEPCGMKAGKFFRFFRQDLKKLPACSQLFMLPGRIPVAIDPESGEFISLEENPLEAGEACFPVAAFLAPGYTGSFSIAYEDKKGNDPLPLFAYTAVVFYKGEFYAPYTCTDRELRQDPRYMDLVLMRRNIKEFKREFPKNRLVAHLENCACVSGCPAAKNFFLKRYEAPLPISPSCNCQCAGCISHQPKKNIPVTQPRIRFVPTPEEIAEVAVLHMKNVKDPIVSFGQGCEGEPLMVADIIEKAIKIIRSKTRKGIINLNTNASKPQAIARLIDAGLDSIRVSLNSVQKDFYHRYYAPKDYEFKDVVKSIKTAKKKGAFVSLNYLVMPGLSDSSREVAAFQKFISSHRIDMIQWRNLNFDPKLYFKIMKCDPAPDSLIGMDEVIGSIHRDFPFVMKGYFNPGKDRMRRHFAAKS